MLLVLFVAAAATHMAIFQLNRRREHKFVFSVLLFGFCMARIAALVMRLVWTSRPTSVPVAIAAGVFTAAGVLLLFLVNLLFAQRLLRAYHPRLGWSGPVRWAFRALMASVVAVLVMVIVTSVHSFFTLDAAVRRKERHVQMFAVVYLAVLAFLPVLIVGPAVLVARRQRRRIRQAAAAAAAAAAEGVEGDKMDGGGGGGIDKFGAGSVRAKLWLLLGTSALLALGAGFRAGVNLSAPRPIDRPAWYHSKAAYYCFNFGIELVVVYAYAIARFDRRFHVPDGCSGPGHYAAGAAAAAGTKNGKAAAMVNTESEVFGKADSDEVQRTDGEEQRDEDDKRRDSSDEDRLYVDAEAIRAASAEPGLEMETILEKREKQQQQQQLQIQQELQLQLQQQLELQIQQQQLQLQQKQRQQQQQQQRVRPPSAEAAPGLVARMEGAGEREYDEDDDNEGLSRTRTGKSGETITNHALSVDGRSKSVGEEDEIRTSGDTVRQSMDKQSVDKYFSCDEAA